MAAIVAAVVLTAIVAGAVGVAIGQGTTRRSIAAAINGRSGFDPVEEHHRQLAEKVATTREVETRVELLELALDALNSGVIVTDQAGNELVRNRLAGELAERFHEKTLIEAAADRLLASSLRGFADEQELEIFGPPARTLFINAVPISADSEIVGALAVIEDVTDFHRVEKTRRDFVANLSHELRTPVGAASLLGEMLVDEDDPEVRRQLTERLMIETDRMTHTIDDLLELSRIESETDQLDEVVVVQTVIADALARIRVAAEGQGVQVGSIIPNDPITVQGNHDQLLTAVVNLLENAVKYSDTGDSVSVRGRVDDAAVSIIVQDTGRGIPARDLDRIFERFYRVDRSRDSATGGTGIGLSIVRHVALNHGGTVEVTSYEGDGSTFTMKLPLPPAEAAESPTIEHEVS